MSWRPRLGPVALPDESGHFFQETHPRDQFNEIAYAPIEQLIPDQSLGNVRDL
jgi:hypothetical protein